MSTCMSLSGVFGIRVACASAYTRGSLWRSICSSTTDRPFFTEAPEIVPTFTPATVAGNPRPGVRPELLENSALSE